MNRRRLVLSLVCALGFVSLQAQECTQSLSIFSEYAKVKNYKDAYTPWKQVYDNCPEMHYATFVYGERILKDKIDNTTDITEKTKLIKDLEGLYEKYNEFFPDRIGKGEVDIKKAMLMYDEKTGTSEEVFSLLDDAFKNHKDEFTSQKALYMYFSELVSLHEAGKKSLQDVFDTYDDVTEKIDQERDGILKTLNELVAKEESGTLTPKEQKNLESYRSKIETFEKITGSIDTKLGKLADCENLIPLYEKNFEANKTNEVWLKRAAGRMSSKDCTSDPMFEKLVISLHNLNPSTSSAYYLGVLNDKNGKSAKAIEYYNEAVSLENDNFEKAKILTRIAHKVSKANAVNYAYKALQYSPSNSEAYKIIASTYASSANECGSTQFEKRAIYWLAAQVARKGGLDSLAQRYEALAPSKADIFESGMAGKTVKFNCWIGKSIKVPSL